MVHSELMYEEGSVSPNGMPLAAVCLVTCLCGGFNWYAHSFGDFTPFGCRDGVFCASCLCDAWHFMNLLCPDNFGQVLRIMWSTYGGHPCAMYEVVLLNYSSKDVVGLIGFDGVHCGFRTTAI